MFVTSTVIDSDPRRIDDGIQFVRDQVVPFVARLEGSLGLLMLVNRVNGRTITNTSWSSAAAMHDSLDALVAIRDQTAGLLGGQASVDRWEVAERQRLRPAEVGFGHRSTRVQLRPADVDLLTETFRTSSIPALSLIPGYCGTALLVDRSAGSALMSMTFDSRRSLEDGRWDSARVPQALLEKAHALAVEVIETQVAVAGFFDPPDDAA